MNIRTRDLLWGRKSRRSTSSKDPRVSYVVMVPAKSMTWSGEVPFNRARRLSSIHYALVSTCYVMLSSAGVGIGTQELWGWPSFVRSRFNHTGYYSNDESHRDRQPKQLDGQFSAAGSLCKNCLIVCTVCDWWSLHRPLWARDVTGGVDQEITERDGHKDYFQGLWPPRTRVRLFSCG